MTNKICSFSVFFIVIFLAINISTRETLAREKNTIQKSDDVVVVSNTKTPAFKIRIVFKEELSIGEVEGDESYMFGGVVTFNTDDEGNFYVTDYDNHRILKYDPEGKYLLTIGREGQGPGEFQTLSVARFDKDNNLYITDAGNRRISFFDKDGKYLKQIRCQDVYNNLHINSKGFLVANKFDMSQDGGIMKMESVYGLFDDKFNLAAEFYIDKIEVPPPTRRDESSLADSLAKLLSTTAFKPNVTFTLTNSDFVYLGYPDKYEVNVYSPEGKLVKKITRDYDPIIVSKKDKEYYVKLMSETFSSWVYTEEVKKRAFQKIKYPKYKPAYRSFTLMENAWLAVIVDSVADEGTLFDIFDEVGKYIGHFKTPILAEGAFSVISFFKNGKAYAVVRENDYMFVKRYNFEIQEFRDNKWVRKK